MAWAPRWKGIYLPSTASFSHWAPRIPSTHLHMALSSDHPTLKRRNETSSTSRWSRLKCREISLAPREDGTDKPESSSQTARRWPPRWLSRIYLCLRTQETTSCPHFQQPEWPENTQPLPQKLACKKWVKKTVLKGTASMEKPQCNWAF